MSNNQKPYDLKVRTFQFAKRVVLTAKKLPKDAVDTPLVVQLVKAGTSVAANYAEADNAESRKDFVHKIGICKKEADESHFWAKLLLELFPGDSDLVWILQESEELKLIFVSIVNSTQRNNQ